MSCLSISLSVLFPGVHRRAGPARPHRRLPRRHARRRQPTGEVEATGGLPVAVTMAL